MLQYVLQSVLNVNPTTAAEIRKRCDTHRNPYVVYLKPRRLATISAQSNLYEAGMMWKTLTDANLGVPPLGQSHDNHLCQNIFTEIFLGLRPLLELKGVPCLDASRVRRFRK